jgi:hypothetical protein
MIAIIRQLLKYTMIILLLLMTQQVTIHIIQLEMNTQTYIYVAKEFPCNLVLHLLLTKMNHAFGDFMFTILLRLLIIL